MNTRLLMVASTLFLALAGLLATFLPQEMLDHFGVPSSAVSALVLQIAGALYLGFAMLNWGARGNVIGGIYSRPVAAGNFLHFVMVAIVLVKGLFKGATSPEFLALAAVYVLFACAFGLVLFTRPTQRANV